MVTHNLEFHRFPFELDGTNLEVNTDCAYVALGIRIIGETEKQAGLGASQRVEAVEEE